MRRHSHPPLLSLILASLGDFAQRTRLGVFAVALSVLVCPVPVAALATRGLDVAIGRSDSIGCECRAPLVSAPREPAPVARSARRAALATATWTLGIEGALGRASFLGERAGFDQGRTAVGAMVFADAASGPWSLRGGIGIAQRGGQSDLGSSHVIIAVKYLELPVTVQYRLKPMRTLTPFAFGGASAAMRLSCNLRFTSSLLSSDEPCSGELGGGNPRLLDFVMLVGAGVSKQFGDAVLEFGVRGARGTVELGAPMDARNRGWSLHVSSRVPVGRLLPAPNQSAIPPSVSTAASTRSAGAI